MLFILNEVVTGFGRTGGMFATTEFGLSPDLITVAKGLSRRMRRSAPCWSDGEC
ncbi:aminotransferase class III-fold pyridoxal phosphate-dependent enzyme [Streptomyces fagopyri]|uniref:aminotransferase class III-fold pyridoxal phosphate-dependent enzyme n=1 Tax=Streptomyces fagopyri TaxID=2662397 RepID=UPI00381E9E42